MATNFVSYSNATELMQAIANKFATLSGAYIFKGSIDFDALPETVTESMVGFVYNINEEFTTDARFIEGAGKVYPAGTNVSIANVSDDPENPELLFDVIGNFIDVAAIYDAIQDVSDMIAAEFDVTAAYTTGDLVVYEGALYKFTSDHAAGAWSSADVAATTVDDLIDAVNVRIDGAVANIADIIANFADEFDATQAYSIGDVVVHGAKLYKFTADHAIGAWSDSDVTEVTVDELIAAEATARANADTAEASARAAADTALASNFADVFDASQAYAIGDVVVYENDVYKFKAAHTAGDPWSASEVDAVTLESLIDAAEPDELTTTQVNTLLGLLD